MRVDPSTPLTITRAAVLTLVVTLIASATPAEELDVNAVCEKTYATPIPDADQQQPGPGVQPLTGCDAEDLYFGITRRRDLVAARHCAYFERSDQSYGYHGAGLLVMVYANGLEVERNLTLARKFACEAGYGAGDIEGLLRHIDELQTGQTTEPLDLCDHRYSGVMEAACAEHDARIASAERERSLAAMTRGWNDAERAALTALLSAGEEYFGDVIYESGFYGSAAAANATSERSALQDGLVSSLQSFASGQLPSDCPTCFRAADEELNRTYGKVLRANFDQSYGISRQGIRETQRKWLRYREALVTFGGIKYPQVSADAWRTYLTLGCTEHLREMLSLADP